MCELKDVIILGHVSICAVSDWKTRDISVFTLVLFHISALLLAIGGDESIWSVLGGVAIGLVFLLVSKLTKEAIGYGDSWVILILGTYLGWKKLIYLLFIASFLAALCSLFYMWKHNWKRDATLPFVPFLAVAYLGVMFL